MKLALYKSTDFRILVWRLDLVVYLVQRLAIAKDEVNGSLDETVFEVVTT